MRAAAFLPGERRTRDEARRERHVGELAVAAGARLDVAQREHGAPQAGPVPHDADILRHRLAQAGDRGGAAERIGGMAAVDAPRLDAGRGSRARRQAADVAGDARAEHDGLEQRVRGEAVGAVQPARGDLAGGPQALDGRASANVGGDAAHVVVGGRRDRDRLAGGVDAGRAAVREDRGKRVRKPIPDRGAAVEEGAAPAAHLGEHRARDDVARASSALVHARHEALAAGVDEDGALPAQRLGRERRRVGPDVERGRVELHELGVGDDGAGAGGERERLAARVGGIGGDGVEAADAARREHHGGGRQEVPDPVAALRRADEADAAHALVLDDQVLGLVVLEHADRRGGADRGDERLHDGGAGAVARDADDAVARVPPPATAGNDRRDRGRRERRRRAGRGCGRGPRRRRAAPPPRRRARRRPRSCRRRAPPWCRPRRPRRRSRPAPIRSRRPRRAGRGDDRHRQGELQGGEQPRQPGPDDDDVAGLELRARRAKLEIISRSLSWAMAASMVRRSRARLARTFSSSGSPCAPRPAAPVPPRSGRP